MTRFLMFFLWVCAADAIAAGVNVSREEAPEQWAAAQDKLGLALHKKAGGAPAAEAAELYGQAVEAYRLALQVQRRETSPREWAATQNNLGTALHEQANRSSAEAARLYGEAVEAYRLAPEVRTCEQMPWEWAATQNNLGIALQNQATRFLTQESGKLYRQAAEAFRLALQVRTRGQSPAEWAATQTKLGSVLRRQAKYFPSEDSFRLYVEAIEALRLALQVYTKAEWPQQWAETQSDLGVCLHEYAGRSATAKSANLRYSEAVDAFRLALQVQTCEHMPREWAITEAHLGVALEIQAKINPAEAQRLYREAAESFSALHLAAPENGEWWFSLVNITKEKLRDPHRAFELHAKWQERNPQDESARAGFAETHLTTERFRECVQLARAPRSRPPRLSTLHRALVHQGAMRVLEIGSLVTLGDIEGANAAMSAFKKEVAGQPAGYWFKGWTWEGTRHFVQTSEHAGVAKNRAWLLALLTASEGKGRDTILKQLNALPKLR